LVSDKLKLMKGNLSKSLNEKKATVRKQKRGRQIHKQKNKKKKNKSSGKKRKAFD